MFNNLKHFYESGSNFTDYIRAIALGIVLVLTSFLFLDLSSGFIFWNFEDLGKLLRKLLIMIFLFFFILKKW